MSEHQRQGGRALSLLVNEMDVAPVDHDPKLRQQVQTFLMIAPPEIMFPVT